MSVIAIIPAKNEEKYIGDVVNEAKKYCDYVYVFDDGSTDKTKEKAKENGANVITNPVNLGLGQNLRHAFFWLLVSKKVTKNDVIITLDGDGQHDAKYIPNFVDKIKKGYDFVSGVRDLSSYPLYKKFGNLFLTLWCSLFSGFKINDSESGYRAFNFNVLKNVMKYSLAKGYGITSEFNIIAGYFHFNVGYVNIESHYIKGKGTKLKNGLINAIWIFISWFNLRIIGKIFDIKSYKI